MLKFILELSLKPNSSAETKLKTELWFKLLSNPVVNCIVQCIDIGGFAKTL